MRVYVEAYGCAQNQGEAHRLAELAAANGHSLTRTPELADVGVLVTCAVIGSTEARMVRRWEELSSRLPRVVVTGCLVPLRTHLLQGPGLERTTFLPIREQESLPQLIGTVSERSAENLANPSAREPSGTREHAAVEVVIAQGCTSHCTYCFSRLARGRLTSVPSLALAARIHEAVRRGASEIRLTSLDTACWGLDRPEEGRLPDLLGIVRDVPGDFQVRVGMMSPQTLAPIADEYFRVLRDPRFFAFLHLPVQSGSDAVLTGMRRGHSVGEFRSLVETARRYLPELMLATDVIVGFPGETEDDFRQTVDLVDSIGAETVNVTRFSARPGTPAARLPPVPSRTAKARSRELTQVRIRTARSRLERWIGEARTGRVVERGPRGTTVVRLSNYLPVVVEGSPPFHRAVRVRIDGARSTYLLGRLEPTESAERG